MKLSRSTTSRIALAGAIAGFIALAGTGSAAGFPLHPGKSMYKGRVNDEGHRATVVVKCTSPGQQKGNIRPGQTIGIVAGDHKGDADPVNSSGKVVATLVGTSYTFTQFGNQPLTGRGPCDGTRRAHFTSPGGPGEDYVTVIFVSTAS